MSSWSFPERIEPPDDDRPVIAVCEECGNDIYGESESEYGDDYFDIPSYGCIHEDCIMEFLRQFKKP